MITVKCKTESSLTLTELKQFQGALKKRSAEDIENLIQSIQTDGLLMPIAIWNDGTQCNILDGHARFVALIKMAIEDTSILTQPLPVVEINAASEEDAKKALLQITSSYGRITKKGLESFVATIPNYVVKAPVVVKVESAALKVASVPKVKETDTVILRLQVKKDMVAQIANILAGVEGVTVL